MRPTTTPKYRLGDRIRARLAKRFYANLPDPNHELGRVYFSISQIAKILGWEETRTRCWLQRLDALVLIGKRRYTTLAILKEKLPDLFKVIKDTGIHGIRPK